MRGDLSPPPKKQTLIISQGSFVDLTPERGQEEEDGRMTPDFSKMREMQENSPTSKFRDTLTLKKNKSKTL